MSAVEDLELKLSHVKQYVRFLNGKRVFVHDYTNSVRASTEHVPAGDLKRGDVFEHPVDSAVHFVHDVAPAGSDVVIKSKPFVVPHKDDKKLAAAISRPLREHRTDRRTLIKRIAGATGLSLMGIGVLAGCATSGGHDPVINQTHRPAAVTQTVQHNAAPVVRKAVPPAPTSATGYKVAFGHIDPTVWGAADVGVTVPLGKVDGQPHTVWLFGDTMSQRPGGFVHSTAITQTGGALHVSNEGKQLLPNDDANHIYWIQGGKAVNATTLHVTARSIHITQPGNVWGFKDNGFSRTALVTIDKSGNANFVKWLNKDVSPPPNPGPMYDFGDHNQHHFGYSRQTHPELKLGGGKVLVSTAQNWDDGLQNHTNPNGTVRWGDFQLVFSAKSVPGT